jgi:branched-chain amino acid transport system ATP-binding protein
MALLEVTNVSVSFGGVKALSGISFAVNDGEIFSVIGPNGAGKTTLFNVVGGVYIPNEGEVHFAGADLKGLPPARRAARGIQRTFQNLQILQSMTVLENVMVGLHLRQRTGFVSALLGLPRIREENEFAVRTSKAILNALNLDQVKDRQAGTLPYGAQKRLEIARAMAAEPKLLLLDEPAAGLNPQETIEMANVIRGIARQGVTILLVEHDMKLVMNVSDRVFVLNFGRALACGTSEQVSNNPEVVKAYLGVDSTEEDRGAALN